MSTSPLVHTTPVKQKILGVIVLTDNRSSESICVPDYRCSAFIGENDDYAQIQRSIRCRRKAEKRRRRR